MRTAARWWLLLVVTWERVSGDCAAHAGCQDCTNTGCVWAEDYGQGLLMCSEGAGGTVVEQVVCCTGDPNHALGASWMCDDGCSMCTCQGDGSIAADGCGGPPTDSQPSTYGLEEHLVEGASLAALTCFVAFGVVCYIMCCCKRAAGPLPTKELEKNEEDEQLAAGD